MIISSCSVKPLWTTKDQVGHSMRLSDPCSCDSQARYGRQDQSCASTTSSSQRGSNRACCRFAAAFMCGRVWIPLPLHQILVMMDYLPHFLIVSQLSRDRLAVPCPKSRRRPRRKAGLPVRQLQQRQHQRHLPRQRRRQRPEPRRRPRRSTSRLG